MKNLLEAVRVPVASDVYATVEKARSYDLAARELMSYPMERVVTLVLPHCVEGMQILHVGSETGVLAHMLGGRFPGISIVGIEENPNFLSVSEENAYLGYLCRTPANVDFQPATFTAFPFGDNSFDIVFTCNTLYRCDKPVELLRECARVVKKDGLGLLYELVRDADRDMVRFVNRYLKTGQAEFERTLRASYTRAEIGQYLTQAGLSDWIVTSENMVVTVTSRALATLQEFVL